MLCFETHKVKQPFTETILRSNIADIRSNCSETISFQLLGRNLTRDTFEKRMVYVVLKASFAVTSS